MIDLCYTMDASEKKSNPFNRVFVTVHQCLERSLTIIVEESTNL